MSEQMSISSFFDANIDVNTKSIGKVKKSKHKKLGKYNHELDLTSVIEEDNCTNRYPNPIFPKHVYRKCRKLGIIENYEELAKKRDEHKKQYLHKEFPYRTIEIAELAEESYQRCWTLIRRIRNRLDTYLSKNKRTVYHDQLEEEYAKLLALLDVFHEKRRRRYFARRILEKVSR